MVKPRTESGLWHRIASVFPAPRPMSAPRKDNVPPTRAKELPFPLAQSHTRIDAGKVSGSELDLEQRCIAESILLFTFCEPQRHGDIESLVLLADRELAASGGTVDRPRALALRAGLC